jgi:2-polyprenyl-6-methoxyphenol hydroxylase-like FAD-dependent oxidoreductase
MSKSELHVIIIGGGIGGLCLAQGLKHMGVTVAVYERDLSPDARLQGYRLNIEPAGSRALHACLPPELWDLLVATAGDPGPRMGVFDERLRELMQEDELGATADPAQSHHAVSRTTLRHLLLAQLEDIVHFNKQFIRYELSRENEVTAFFSDGTSASGHLLIGADGARSRVRDQLLPNTCEVQVPAVGVGGKLFLTEQTAAWLPAHLQTTKNMILPPRDFLFTAAFRSRHAVGDRQGAVEDRARRLSLDPRAFSSEAQERDYVMWAFVANRRTLRERPANPSDWRRIIEQRMEGWSPTLQRLVHESDLQTIQAFDFSAAKKPRPWATTRVTLMGDALHFMPPVGGMGGNAALHDAALLCKTLTELKSPEQLLESLHECEAEMIRNGFRAVDAALLYTKLAISRIPLMRQLARTFFRACGVIGPLRRAIFTEEPAGQSDISTARTLRGSVSEIGKGGNRPAPLHNDECANREIETSSLRD